MSRVLPILFNTDMVRAILDGRKTVTRRCVKPQHLKVLESPYHKAHQEVPDDVLLKKLCEPPYQPGDILYVRETWGDYRECQEGGCGYYMYRADYPDGATAYLYDEGTVCDLPRWRPSLHMPKEAARIWLKVTDVRVERLQDMKPEDARKEGTKVKPEDCVGKFDYISELLMLFSNLWNSTIKKSDLDRYGWDANPYVFVIEFERCEKP